MNSYIVRIYRQEADKPSELVGAVEEVGVEGKKAFTNIDELWEILNNGSMSIKKCKGSKSSGEHSQSHPPGRPMRRTQAVYKESE